METAVVDIGGRKLAVGFDWSPAGRITSKVVQTQGTSLGADAVAQRRSQLGFGRSDGDDPDACFRARAAAAVVEPPETSFAVRLHLQDIRGEDIWWVFSRINDQNIGMGDSVHRTAESAQACFDEIRRFLPPDVKLETEMAIDSVEDAEAWIENALDLGLIGWLTGKGSVCRLTSWHGRGIVYLELIVIGAALIFGLWQGATKLKEWFTEQGLTRQSTLRAKQVELRREFVKKHPEKIWEARWAGSAKPSDAGESCLSMVQSTPIALAGWKWNASTCTVSGGTAQASAQYRKTPVSVYFGLPKGTSVSANKPGELKESRRMSGMDVRWDGTEWKDFFTQEWIRKWFLQYSQIWKLKTNVKFHPKEKFTEKDTGTFECPWARGDFTVSGVPTAELIGAMKALDVLPGMRIRSMKFQRNWEIKGEIHGK